MISIVLPLCLCATISLESDAKRLFIPEKINNTSVFVNGEYIDFRNRMNLCDNAALRSSVESLIVNAITSIVISVSTNYLDGSTEMDSLKFYTDYFKNMFFKSISTNDCMSLASYLNSIQPIQYPTNLVSARLNVHRYRFEVSTNSSRDVKHSLQKINNIKLYDEKKKQICIYNANKEVDEYRKLIISICGQGIFAFRKIMDDDEFSNFTNQVVRLSNASEKEQKILFQKLNEGLRSHNKK
jgi:hypothetical protein